MFKQVITLILVCIVFCLAGCRSLVNTSRRPNKHVQTWPVLDPNNYSIHIVKGKDGTSASWNRNINCMDCPDKFTLVMPYWGGSWIINNVPTVRGQMNGTSYPVILDTGDPVGVIVTDIHINKHKLPVYFFNPDDKNNSTGLAIATLNLSRLRFENYPCFFFNYHADISFLGLSTDWLAQAVILPLDFMSGFSWTQYDQIHKELSISTEVFTPENKAQWMTFPFEITNKQIRVPVAMEGNPIRLFLDTGGGFMLNLTKDQVQQLYEKRPDLQKIRKKKSVSLTPYVHGKVNDLEITPREIQFGDTILKNATIQYNEQVTDPNLFPYEGTMGIDLFKHTIMVLDFEKKLIRVKKTKGSLFEP
jgi:hypothetical protein